MAKASKTSEGQTNGQPVTETVKPKRENLFTNTAATEWKKKEAKLRFGFNVTANKIKKMGLSPDSERQIIDILKKEYETKAAAVFSAPAVETGAEASSFV